MNRPRLTWKVWLIVLTGCAALTVVLLRFTSVCTLHAVTLDGQPVADWEKDLGFKANVFVLEQPVDSVAAVLLKKPSVLKVDIDYAFPDRIDIRTNDFQPVCLVVDGRTGKLRGVNNDGRVVGIRTDAEDWEYPIVTGVASAPLFRFCSDDRVREIATQLQQVRDNDIDLYRLIDEVNLSHRTGVRVTLAGLPYVLITWPESLAVSLSDFIRFAGEFTEETLDAREFDLRYTNMLVKTGKPQRHGR